MTRLYPDSTAVRPAAMGERRCWNCQKCERKDGSAEGRCELRAALHGSDNGEQRLWTDRSCPHWTRRV